MSMRKTPGSSQVNFHYGKTLMKLAQTYVSLFEAVNEAVQNAIDSGADNIAIVVDRKKRAITIVDNGEGASRKKFEEALSRVAYSMKERDKLGQFGLGLISPLGKCEKFTFTSCPRRGGEGYLQWTFETEAILAQAKEIKVPCSPMELTYKPAQQSGRANGPGVVDWRTRVSIEGYSTDRVVSRIQSADALKEAIIDKFGVAMRRNDVAIGVLVINENGTTEKSAGKAKRFSGKKLPEVVIENKDGGKTIFRLFLARKGTFGYQGKVLVGEAGNDYRFAFSVFAKGVSGLLGADAIELLKSGIFEGEVLTSQAKLHEDRKSFVANDAHVGFCIAIDQWFSDHGKKHMREVEEQRKGERLQNVSLRSLQTIEDLLGSDEFERLREETIGSFQLGTVGSGHIEPKDSKVVGVQASPSVSTSASGSARDANGTGHSNDTPDAEKEAHAPFTVAGPRGQQRTIVKGGSRGLQFDHAAMRPEGPPWILEPKRGTLFFNVEHPVWLSAFNAGDRQLMQFQELGAVMALVQHTMPEEYQSVASLALHEVIAPVGFLLFNSPSFNLKARFKAASKAD